MKLDRRSFIHAGCAVAIATLVPSIVDRAEARFPRDRGSNNGSIPTGRSSINGFDATDFPFKNFIKMASSFPIGGAVDANGYATTNAAGFGMHLVLPVVESVSSTSYQGRYRLYWTGTYRYAIGAACNIYDGGAGVGLGGNTGRTTNFIADGNLSALTPNGYVEFDFSWAVTGAVTDPASSGQVQLTVPYTGLLTAPFICTVSGVGGVPGANGTFAYTITSSTTILLIGSTFSGSYTSGGSFQYFPTSFDPQMGGGSVPSSPGNLILCRASAPYAGDLAAILTGVPANQFNDDFVTKMRAANFYSARFMDVSGINNALLSRHSCVPPVAAMTYQGQAYPPNVWVTGGTTLANTYQFSCAAAPDTPATWTDGECFQVKIGNSCATVAVSAASSGAGGLVRLTVPSTANFPSKVSFLDNANTLNGTWSINIIDGTHIDLVSDIAGNPSVFVATTTGTLNVATINVNSRGAKIMTYQYGAPFQIFGEPAPVANDFLTCVYDALQDVVLVAINQGVPNVFPVEVRVALCNKINTNFWWNIPPMYDLASVATETAIITANLSAGIGSIPEYGNELWNPFFKQGQWCRFRGIALKFPNQGISWVALRHRQIMGQITTTWGGRSGLKRNLPWQAAWSPDISTYLYQGSELVASNAKYLAWVGGSDPGYNSAPNRPIDFSDDIGYAPYYSGVLGPGGIDTSQVNALDVLGMTTAADNFASGGAGIAAAFAWMDNDIRQGAYLKINVSSVTGGNTFNTATPHGFPSGKLVIFSTSNTLYPQLSLNNAYYVVNPTSLTFQISATFNGSPISVSGGSGTQTVGLLLETSMLFQQKTLYGQYAGDAVTFSKGVKSYEGGYGAGTLSQAQCTTLGISTTYGGTGNQFGVSGGKVWDMMVAYKKDATFQATVLKQNNDQVAALAGTIPCWYKLGGNGTPSAWSYPWSLEILDLNAFFKSYDALVQFNN